MTPGDFCQPLYQNKVVTWKPLQCLTTVNARCNQSTRTSSFVPWTQLWTSSLVPWLHGNEATGQAASFPGCMGGSTGQEALQSIVPACIWTMRIAWLGNMARPNNFHGYGTSQDQREGLTDPFRGGLWSCLPQISATQPPHTTCKI